MEKISVVGCGISGLSSALLLARAGNDVAIISKELPPNTTSNKAAAFWSPYYANGERVTRWSKESFWEYEKLCAIKESGISMKELRCYHKTGTPQSEDWTDAIPNKNYRSLSAVELPIGFDEGFSLQVPLIETQIFLPYLINEFINAGGIILQREIKSLDELSGESDLIINCTGMGARTLVNDVAMIPVKGQIVFLDLHLEIPIILDEHAPTYIVQRKDGCMVGGTREENIYTETVDEETLKNIIARASDLVPEIKTAKRITEWAGLRPYRNKVRCERNGNIIHNYGHGGSGFTLAWGCANEVLELVKS